MATSIESKYPIPIKIGAKQPFRPDLVIEMTVTAEKKSDDMLAKRYEARAELRRLGTAEWKQVDSRTGQHIDDAPENKIFFYFDNFKIHEKGLYHLKVSVYNMVSWTGEPISECSKILGLCITVNEQCVHQAAMSEDVHKFLEKMETGLLWIDPRFWPKPQVEDERNSSKT